MLREHYFNWRAMVQEQILKPVLEIGTKPMDIKDAHYCFILLDSSV